MEMIKYVRLVGGQQVRTILRPLAVYIAVYIKEITMKNIGVKAGDIYGQDQQKHQKLNQLNRK